MVEVLIC